MKKLSPGWVFEHASDVVASGACLLDERISDVMGSWDKCLDERLLTSWEMG